jgi:hypothetical protein
MSRFLAGGRRRMDIDRRLAQYSASSGVKRHVRFKFLKNMI